MVQHLLLGMWKIMDRFVINDDSKANWAFRKLADIKQEKEKVNDQMAAYEKQNAVWFKQTMNPLIEKQEYFRGLIEEYRLTKPDGKVKTPAGQTVVRIGKRYERDDKKILPFLEKNHQELVKKTVDWSGLKKSAQVKDGKAYDENGEQIPGVKVAEHKTVSYRTN